jgi:hypothetical protein
MQADEPVGGAAEGTVAVLLLLLMMMMMMMMLRVRLTGLSLTV